MYSCINCNGFCIELQCYVIGIYLSAHTFRTKHSYLRNRQNIYPHTSKLRIPGTFT